MGVCCSFWICFDTSILLPLNACCSHYFIHFCMLSTCSKGFLWTRRLRLFVVLVLHVMDAAQSLPKPSCSLEGIVAWILFWSLQASLEESEKLLPISYRMQPKQWVIILCSQNPFWFSFQTHTIFIQPKSAPLWSYRHFFLIPPPYISSLFRDSGLWRACVCLVP